MLRTAAQQSRAHLHGPGAGGRSVSDESGSFFLLKDELNCLFPEHHLLCCDVVAVQTVKQPMNEALGAGHKLEKSDWSVVGKCCYSLATATRALLNFNTKLALVYLMFTGLSNR